MAKMTKLLDSIVRAGLIPPKIVTLMITNSCNLSCRHCLPESSCYDTSSSVPPDAIKELIEAFVCLGVEEVCLTGGEPLVHPDWLEILSFACRQTCLNRVTLQTNGILLTEAAIEALCSIDFKGLTVQVSLEGATEEANDRVRNSGSFKRIIRGLKLLAEAGLGQQVVVAFTEMQHNFSGLPDLLKLLDELGIGRLVTGTMIMGGRAAKTDC